MTHNIAGAPFPVMPGEMIRIARRDYEGVRRFLIVNPLQGKHLPVSPRRALGMMRSLGEAVKNAFPGEKILCVGFAETATAIGAVVAEILDAPYIHTTREYVSGTDDYFFFQETHSRWTEQKLCAENWDVLCAGAERIVFIEDEISTGNTIRSLASLLREKGAVKKTAQFAVASLVNTLDSQNERKFAEAAIDSVCLLKISSAPFDEMAGIVQPEPRLVREPSAPQSAILNFAVEIGGKIDPRRGAAIQTYLGACDRLAKAVTGMLESLAEKKRAFGMKNALFLGTEECMFPALIAASAFEDRWPEIPVFCHATTRTPIAPSSQPDYPVQSAWKLRSVYDSSRETFVYNLRQYDTAVIVTDTELTGGALIPGMNDICGALSAYGKQNIIAVRWPADA
jgi:adenine/guanine phosphoribosyltransferase-like PRPP-binding protein